MQHAVYLHLVYIMLHDPLNMQHTFPWVSLPVKIDVQHLYMPTVHSHVFTINLSSLKKKKMTM